VSDRNPVLTPAQADTWEKLKAWVAEHDGPPSLDELAGACGVSRGAVRASLEQLQRKGFIRRARYVDRGIEILEETA
jgi:predicted ArsR family transcriptional regulator